jgi:hypothetical protein
LIFWCLFPLLFVIPSLQPNFIDSTNLANFPQVFMLSSPWLECNYSYFCFFHFSDVCLNMALSNKMFPTTDLCSHIPTNVCHCLLLFPLRTYHYSTGSKCPCWARQFNGEGYTELSTMCIWEKVLLTNKQTPKPQRTRTKKLKGGDG